MLPRRCLPTALVVSYLLGFFLLQPHTVMGGGISYYQPSCGGSPGGNFSLPADAPGNIDGPTISYDYATLNGNFTCVGNAVSGVEAIEEFSYLLSWVSGSSATTVRGYIINSNAPNGVATVGDVDVTDQLPTVGSAIVAVKFPQLIPLNSGDVYYLALCANRTSGDIYRVDAVSDHYNDHLGYGCTAGIANCTAGSAATWQLIIRSGDGTGVFLSTNVSYYCTLPPSPSPTSSSLPSPSASSSSSPSASPIVTRVQGDSHDLAIALGVGLPSFFILLAACSVAVAGALLLRRLYNTQ